MSINKKNYHKYYVSFLVFACSHSPLTQLLTKNGLKKFVVSTLQTNKLSLRLSEKPMQNVTGLRLSVVERLPCPSEIILLMKRQQKDF